MGPAIQAVCGEWSGQFGWVVVKNFVSGSDRDGVRIRRLYPKGSLFAKIGKVELQRSDRYLNDRPRRCLGWKTLREALDSFLASAP